MHIDQQYPEVVYFMVRDDGMVKIGRSRYPTERVARLRRRGDGLRIAGTIPGGSYLERRLHRRYAALRVTGEWFRRSGALAKFLDRLDTPGVVESIRRRVSGMSSRAHWENEAARLSVQLADANAEIERLRWAARRKAG